MFNTLTISSASEYIKSNALVVLLAPFNLPLPLPDAFCISFSVSNIWSNCVLNSGSSSKNSEYFFAVSISLNIYVYIENELLQFSAPPLVNGVATSSAALMPSP